MNLVFKYFGKTPDPDRKMIFSGAPIDLQEFRHGELTSFSQAYRNEVSNTVRRSRKLFRNGIYCTLTPQLGSFDHLRDMFKNAGYSLEAITRASFEKDEALFRVQVRVPVEPSLFGKVFHEKLIQPESKGFVNVSFYVGVCPAFVSLQKPDELMDMLRQATKKAKDESDPDPAFDPETVLPVFIKHNRLEVRQSYLHSDDPFGNKKYYQSPEGYIYHIVVDGYSLVEPPEMAINYRNL